MARWVRRPIHRSGAAPCADRRDRAARDRPDRSGRLRSSAPRGTSRAIPRPFRAAGARARSCWHPTRRHRAPRAAACGHPNDAGRANRRSTCGRHPAAVTGDGSSPIVHRNGAGTGRRPCPRVAWPARAVDRPEVARHRQRHERPAPAVGGVGDGPLFALREPRQSRILAAPDLLRVPLRVGTTAARPDRNANPSARPRFERHGDARCRAGPRPWRRMIVSSPTRAARRD